MDKISDSDFLNNLKNNINIKRKITDIEINGIYNIILGIIFIICGVYFIFKLGYVYNKIKTLEDIKKYNMKTKNSNNILFILQGIISIFIGIKILFFYKPTNTEISTAILIKILFLNKTINKDIYDILKNLKPYRINKIFKKKL